MFRLIPVLSPDQVRSLREIAASATFVDGRISNPHSPSKNNLQLHDPEKHQRSAEIMLGALLSNQAFREFAFPKAIAPPMLARYTVGMAYGVHIDTAILPLPLGLVRTDLSCTIFLSDPSEYVGGALRILLGDRSVSFKERPGTAVIYPSTTLHEVEKVTEGERLVGLTFVQSRIGDVERRMLMYELNEIAALEGLSMRLENFTRLQGVQANLMRRWADAP